MCYEVPHTRKQGCLLFAEAAPFAVFYAMFLCVPGYLRSLFLISLTFCANFFAIDMRGLASCL